MKISILSILLSMIVTFAFAQAKPAEWPDLKDMHGVISQTFHPAEEGNLVPIKSRAHELTTKAGKLASSKIPAGLNKAEIKAATTKLLAEAKKMEALVKENASDADLKAQLSKVHDAYHEVAGMCTKEGE